MITMAGTFLNDVQYNSTIQVNAITISAAIQSTVKTYIPTVPYASLTFPFSLYVMHKNNIKINSINSLIPFFTVFPVCV